MSEVYRSTPQLHKSTVPTYGHLRLSSRNMKNTFQVQHPRLGFVDHAEAYGRHLLEQTCKSIPCNTTLDLGCGSGNDLMIVKKSHPDANCIGVEFSERNKEKLVSLGIQPFSVNIENQKLPIADCSLDLVIANQVFEHTKEIFWINHEIFGTLKIGGHLYLGVPNTLSLHNRLLGLVGTHPTCVQTTSAHVRSFSKRDTIKFYDRIGSSFCKVNAFQGAQFYPFPPSIGRPLANLFPSMAVTIFFLIRKTADYNTQFLDWVGKQQLETNFFVG